LKISVQTIFSLHLETDGRPNHLVSDYENIMMHFLKYPFTYSSLSSIWPAIVAYICEYYSTLVPFM